jgi:hypothetical protein
MAIGCVDHALRVGYITGQAAYLNELIGPA